MRDGIASDGTGCGYEGRYFIAAQLDIKSQIPIYMINMEGRVKNILKELGIETIEMLCKMSERDLLRHPRAGRVTILQIKSVLKLFGFSLAKDM